MRWVKAALLLVASAALAVASYVVLDNIAVPAAIAIIGVIVACMSVALSGSDTGPAPVANPRAGGPVPSAAPNRVPAPGEPASRYQPGYRDGRSEGHVQTHGQVPPPAGRWPRHVDPDTEAWREARRR
ncbi:hypothetical protein [Cryptosporangium arvum]|uniref:hypothetical protein n=1 Tax=Cryptosporangium arvum TaxID=80871 RepID=UPI0012EE518C|nr:hypothetical protein [Cryptosporangium arvum]